MSLAREIVFVSVICCAQLLTQVGLGQTIAPLQIIADSFEVTDPGQKSWFVAAYPLTVGTFILIAGRLEDSFGHKNLLVIGYFWFGLWSLLTGVTVYSHSHVFFEVCRAMGAIGPVMMLPNAKATSGSVYPPGRRKEMIFSFFALAAPDGL